MYWREKKRKMLEGVTVAFKNGLITEEAVTKLVKIAKMTATPEIAEVNDRVERQLCAMGIPADVHQELAQLMGMKVAEEHPEILEEFLVSGLFGADEESTVRLSAKLTSALLDKIGLEDNKANKAARNQALSDTFVKMIACLEE